MDGVWYDVLLKFARNYTNKMGSAHRALPKEEELLTLLHWIPEVGRKCNARLVPRTSNWRVHWLLWRSGANLYPGRWYWILVGRSLRGRPKQDVFHNPAMDGSDLHACDLVLGTHQEHSNSMNVIISPAKWKYTLVYLKDIIVLSCSPEEPRAQVRQVLNLHGIQKSRWSLRNVSFSTIKLTTPATWFDW